MEGLYNYRVSNQPFDHETFQPHQASQHHNPTNTETFIVYFSVRFTLRSSTHSLYRIRMPSPHSSQFIPCKHFFQNGPALLRSNLSHPWIPPQALDVLIPKMISDAQRLYQNQLRPHVALYPLALDVIVEIPETDETVAEIERVTWASMQEVRMVPASEEAIQSLKPVKLQQNVADTNQCCICLEQFEDGAKVSAMPCHHVYHNDCIVQWLKTSHFCPLCRYSMSLPNNS